MVAGCSDPEDKLPQPQVQDAKQEMRDVMKYTAQVVSQVVASPAARNEVLGYAFSEFDGEVEASFDKLLSDEPKKGLAQRSLVNGAPSGKFAELFRPRAKQYVFESEDERSESVNDAISRLESYLKKHNLGLYGPYLAENHENSTKPITVSFDPLDDTKTTSTGYMFVPKSTSGNSSANNGGIDSPKSYYDGGYELVNIGEIDDDYAYNNPTLFITPNGGGSSGGAGNSSASNNTTGGREIDCETLSSTAIVELGMPKFRLNGNLRRAPWSRNILQMWAITGDNISGFNPSGKGILNENTSNLWTWKKVSRRNARKKRWLNPDISFLKSNWKKSEVDMVILITYKDRSKKTKIDLNVKTVLSTGANGNSTSTTTITTTVKYGRRFTELGYQNFDRCSVLANFKKDRGNGLYEGRRIYTFEGKLDFTMQPYVN